MSDPINSSKILLLSNSQNNLETVLGEINNTFSNIVNVPIYDHEKLFNEMSSNNPVAIITIINKNSSLVIDVLKYVKGIDPEIPFIIVAEYIEKDILIEVLKEGADNYITIDNIGKLNNLIIQEIVNYKEKKSQEKDSDGLLSYSSKECKRILNNSADWIWQTDLNWNILYSTSAAFNIIGIKAYQVINRCIFDYVHEVDLERYANILKGSSSRLEENTLEIKVVDKTGKIVNVESYSSPHFSMSGEHIGYTGYFRDLTIKTKNQELEVYNNLRSRILLDLPTKSTKKHIEDFIKSTLLDIATLTKSRTVIIQNIDTRNINSCYFINDKNKWKSFSRFDRELVNNYLSYFEGKNVTINNDTDNHYWIDLSIKKHMLILLRLKDNTSIILGLADKILDYTVNDSHTLELVVNEMNRLILLDENVHRLRSINKVLDEAQRIACIGNWEWNLSERSYSWSKMIYEIIGVNETSKPVPISEFNRYLNPISLNRFRKTLLSDRNNQDTFECDLELESTKGKDKWITVRGLYHRDSIGKVKSITGTVQDITDRIINEQKLRELAVAIEQSTENIVLTDLNGDIVYVNESFQNNSMYSLMELVGSNPNILQSGKTSKSTYKELWDTLLSGNTWKGILYNRKKNGDEYTEYAVISPLKKADGTIYRYIGVKEDITQKKKLEEDLDKYRHKLEKLVEERTIQLESALMKSESFSKAKDDFLTIMSHEIRTPLNSVIGMSNLLDRTELTLKQREYVKTIKFSGDVLLGIINDVLDISKIASGNMKLENKDIDLTSMLNQVNNILKDKAESKGLSFEIINNVDIKELKGDYIRLSQALINVINNSIKFTNKGYIRVNVNTLSESDSSAILKFSIKDSGIGISKSSIKKLFEPFVQEDVSKTREYGGTGLGLSITKGIVEQMKGEIGIKSNLGKGTEIWFTVELTIPKFDPEEKTGTKPIKYDPETILQNEFRNIKILIVDDDSINRLVLKELLVKLDAKIDFAVNGKRAVNLIKKGKIYDLIFMDMQMPVMGGVEATMTIRAIAGCKSVPIIALTANAYKKFREECYDAGISDFVSKPYNTEEIFNTILKWVKKRGESGEINGIDIDHIKSIFGSDSRKYSLLLGKFCERYKNIESDISKILADSGLDSVRDYIHKLKGASGTLGLKYIMNYSKNILDNLDQSTITSNVKELNNNIKELELLEISEMIGNPGKIMNKPENLNDDILKNLRSYLKKSDVYVVSYIEENRRFLNEFLGDRLNSLEDSVLSFNFKEAMEILNNL